MPNDLIKITTKGQEKTFLVTTKNGNGYLDFYLPADGTYNNGLWASFKNKPACADEGKYNLPPSCVPTPECELNIYKVEVGNCYYDQNDYKSKAKLKVCVEWAYAPAGENIVVSISGQQKVVAIGNNSSGNACVEFIVPANSTYNNGIWAKFQYTTACQDEDKYNTPNPCQPAPECDLDIYKVEVGNCYIDPADNQSKVKVKICVQWKNAVQNDIIVISANGQSKAVYASVANGSACVELKVPADGTYNNGIWAKFSYNTACQGDAKYNAPPPCQSSPGCDLNIYKVEVSECYFDHNDYQSKAKLKVCLTWNGAPQGEKLKVFIDNQNQTVPVNASNGSACVEFVIPANGGVNLPVVAKFETTSACRDEKKYNAPVSCQPAPECELDIYKVEVGNCYFDHNDYQSKVKLKICVNWAYAPLNQNIVVSIAGQQKTILVNTYSGSGCVEFTVPANGTYNNGIWAKFQNSTACQDEAKYNTPNPCQPVPECDLDIFKVEVSDCYYDHSDYQSKVKLRVCVNWNNAPVNEKIKVIINGQQKTITPYATSGNACVEFIVAANGTYNNGIWAKFETTTACQDEAIYHTPAGCQPVPECDLNITEVWVGNCYFDHYDYKSKAPVRVYFSWTNAMPNDFIKVSTGNQEKSLYVTTTSGSGYVDFIVPANGTYNNGIWAKFKNKPGCADEDKYNAPNSCQPAPECDLNIYKVEAGECYFDHNTYQSKFKLKVCVEWKNAPAGEKIYVYLSGQYKVIIPNSYNGSACLEFIVLANGSYDNGIWATFEYTEGCKDIDWYHAPNPCVPLPECDLDIYKVEVSNCYFDHNDYQSKAKLKVCVNWENAPSDENILVSIAGQQKTVYVGNNNSGNACVEFIVPANGTYNNGIWAKFKNTTSCQDEDKYNTPNPCIPTPECDLDITEIWVGNCVFDQNSYQSKAQVRVYFKWTDAMPTDYIKITTKGQEKSFTVTTKDGNGYLDFYLPADGTSSNGLWASFKNKPACTDEDKYNLPNPCQPAPECDLDITEVWVGECYFDHNSYQSLVKVRVYLKWTDAMPNDLIKVTTGDKEQSLSVTTVNGSGYVDFIVPANGTNNNGIWAKFKNKPGCADEDKYNAPNPCQPLPECDLNIKKVEVSECRYDNSTGKSRATVTVCVEWKDAPANEQIEVAITGQNKSFLPAGSNGSYCVEFVVNADGSDENGIWAKFKNTTSCQDEDSYDLPEPCPPMICDCEIPSDRDKIKVTFSLDCKTVCICSGRDISNLVFDLGNGCFQNFDIDIKKEGNELTGNPRKQTYTFNTPINGVWVKAGNNKCTDDPNDRGCDGGPGGPCCPGCGEYFECGDPDNYYYGLLKAAPAGNNTDVSTPFLFNDVKIQETEQTTVPNELRVYPNPTSNALFVDLSSFAGKAAHVQVFNTVGQLMYQAEIDEIAVEATRLDLSNLASDMYFLKVYIPNEGLFTQKFIVRK